MQVGKKNRDLFSLAHELFLGDGEVVPILSSFHHGFGKLRMIMEDAAEVGFLQYKQVTLNYRLDCRGTRRGNQQTNLAKKVAVPECLDCVTTRVYHFNFSVGDQVH